VSGWRLDTVDSTAARLATLRTGLLVQEDELLQVFASGSKAIRDRLAFEEASA
jgi:hypothetical protein